MNRQINYYGALVRTLDPLLIGQNAMVGIAKLAEATLGTAGVSDGFQLNPTATPSMSLNLSVGQVYQQANLEASAISLLNQDTHTIVKQGFIMDPVGLTFTAPTGAGNAYNVLVQVQYADSDTASTVLNYYNAASPTTPFNGPGNNGTSQVTQRQSIVQIGTKYGTAAAAGSQLTPAPDAGWIGLFVVTLAYGQTQITAGNIAAYTLGNTIPDKLPNLPAGIQNNKYSYVKDTGVADAYIVAPNPPLKQRVDGTELLVLPKNNNASTTPTINDGLGVVQITKRDGTPVTANDIVAGVKMRLICDGTNYRLASMASSDVNSGVSQATVNQAVVTSISTNRIPTNFRRIANNVRTTVSGTGGSFVTGITWPTYTKLGAASATNLLVIAQVGAYGGNNNNAGPVVQILSDQNGHSDSQGFSSDFWLSGVGAISVKNTTTFVLTGVPAGNVNLISQFGGQAPGVVWSNNINPDSVDYGQGGSHTGTGGTSYLTLMELPV